MKNCWGSRLIVNGRSIAMSDMCKKVSRKINALAGIAPFININKRHTYEFIF